ncbi:hypothetical protein ACFE04_009785 [Oxalis oulophora]
MAGHSKIKFLSNTNGQVKDQGLSSGEVNPIASPFVPAHVVSDISLGSKARKLNPNAFPFDPALVVNEVDRSIFLTFSKGFPISPKEIQHFFERRFKENCVEKVYVDNRPGKIPLFGKIRFHKLTFTIAILGNKPSTKLIVNGKPLWCKRFQQGRTTKA